LINKDCSNLRVLFVGSYPPPYGGIASLIQLLIPGLKRFSAQDIAVLSFGNVNKIEQVDGALIYRYQLISQIWKILLPWKWKIILKTMMSFKGYQLSLKKKILFITKTLIVNDISKTHQSNVVYFFHSNSSLDILPLSKIWKNKIGIVLEIFGEIYDEHENVFIKEHTKLFNDILSIPQVITASSQHCANSFKQIGINKPVEVIYIGVDLSRFTHAEKLKPQYREQFNCEKGTVLFLFFGRFVRAMGLESLIEAIPKVIKEKKNVRFILAGASGPLDKTVSKFANNYSDYVKVINNIPFEDMPSFYVASDVLLAPSRDHRACMGISIKDAMAFSRPVIGTNSGGIPEAIIHNETGLIVPHKENGEIDVEGLAKAMIYLSNFKEVRKSMGHKARLRAEKMFSEKDTIIKTADVLIRCIPNE